MIQPVMTKWLEERYARLAAERQREQYDKQLNGGLDEFAAILEMVGPLGPDPVIPDPETVDPPEPQPPGEPTENIDDSAPDPTSSIISEPDDPLMAPRIYFAPKGGLAAAYAAEIDKASQWLHAQYYVLTNQQIVDAFIRARKRRVKVEIILDLRQLKTSKKAADQLMAARCTVLVDGKHAIAHNKVCLRDGVAVLHGSFNPTVSGEKSNAENMMVDVRKTVIRKLEANYQAHKAHSVPYSSIPLSKRKLTKADLRKLEAMERKAMEAEGKQI